MKIKIILIFYIKKTIYYIYNNENILEDLLKHVSNCKIIAEILTRVILIDCCYNQMKSKLFLVKICFKSIKINKIRTLERKFLIKLSRKYKEIALFFKKTRKISLKFSSKSLMIIPKEIMAKN